MVIIDGKSWQAEFLKEEGGEISVAIVEPNGDLGSHFKFMPLAGGVGSRDSGPSGLTVSPEEGLGIHGFSSVGISPIAEEK